MWSIAVIRLVLVQGEPGAAHHILPGVHGPGGPSHLRGTLRNYPLCPF
jgi:hypothetical protein